MRGRRTFQRVSKIAEVLRRGTGVTSAAGKAAEGAELARRGKRLGYYKKHYEKLNAEIDRSSSSAKYMQEQTASDLDTKIRAFNDLKAADEAGRKAIFKEKAELEDMWRTSGGKRNRYEMLAYKRAGERLKDGPTLMDGIMGNNIPAKAAGTAIGGGILASVFGNNGRRSNLELYSNPF